MCAKFLIIVFCKRALLHIVNKVSYKKNRIHNNLLLCVICKTTTMVSTYLYLLTVCVVLYVFALTNDLVFFSGEKPSERE